MKTALKYTIRQILSVNGWNLPKKGIVNGKYSDFKKVKLCYQFKKAKPCYQLKSQMLSRRNYIDGTTAAGDSEIQQLPG